MDNKLDSFQILMLILALGSFIFFMSLSAKHEVEKKPNYTRHYLHFR